MTTTNIPLSECYAIQVHKQATGSDQTVTITQTFTGSKVPGEQRRIWRVTAPDAVMKQIAYAIKGDA